LLAALLSACETPRVGMAPAAPEAAVSTEVAEKAERDGEFVLAAREYERLAEIAPGAQRQDLLLRAVHALIKAGELREARHRLGQVSVAGLEPSFAARKQMLEARLLMLDGKHERAIRQLNDALAARNLNPTLIAEMLAARAQAELALDNAVGAVRNLISREQYIAGKEAIAENRLQIWKTLEGLKRERLSAELSIARDPVLAGWIELALAVADAADNPAVLEAGIERWKQAYAKHPAAETILPTLLDKMPRLAGHFERIALLLPLGSPYGTAAAAVRDGFLAMRDAVPQAERPSVKVYDIGADPAQAPSFYEQAVKDGAQIVIGPLGREATDAIVRQGGFAVPTLLLSHTDESITGAGRYVFQFGLPPEQEARQVAERAYLDGHRDAAVLYPKDAWGERMQQAFVDHWQKLGGVVLAAQSYDNPRGDFSDSIKRLLNIEQSEARKELLEKKLKQKLQFEARARQDVDFVFLAADARHGRLIKPQLNFYRAARVPVYATSHIYTGRNDPVRDVDLDGVLFADMPWMLVNDGNIPKLRERLQHDWPNALTDLDRLYALGVDSYAILPHLGRISADSTARFSGVTSALSLDRQGRLQRHLVWAQFKKGVPRLVDTYQKYRGHLEVEPATGG
jgi:hypothetical protein